LTTLLVRCVHPPGVVTVVLPKTATTMTVPVPNEPVERVTVKLLVLLKTPELRSRIVTVAPIPEGHSPRRQR
jgi:hypothetical protein